MGYNLRHRFSFEGRLKNAHGESVRVFSRNRFDYAEAWLRFLTISFAFCLFAGVIIISRHALGNSPVLVLISFVLVPVAAGVAWVYSDSYKTFFRIQAHHAALDQGVPFIFYLRQFNRDKALFRDSHPILEALSVGKNISLQQYIGEHLSNTYPVVSIGQPDEKWPRGVFSVYSDHDTWKDVASYLMKNAEHVIVWPSDGMGIRWEIEQVGKTIKRNKVVIFLFDEDGIPYSREEISTLKEGALAPFKDALETLEGPAWWIGFDESDKGLEIKGLYASKHKSLSHGSREVPMQIMKSLKEHLSR